MFTVTQVGSWPRSKDLLRALRDKQKGRMTAGEFDRVADGEVRRCVEHQVAAGVDIVVDGEQRRDNFYSFVTDKLDGTKLMSLAEMLDTVEDKSGFEEMLDTLDVPASAIKNPTCVGRTLEAGAAGGERASLRAADHRQAGEGHVARTVPARRAPCGWAPSPARATATRRRWATTW